MTTKPTTIDPRLLAHEAELRAFCYRMLGSLQDADDAYQETLVGAWRGLDGFEGRSSIRAWLYRIATNACLHVASKRPMRELPDGRGPSSRGTELEPRIEEPVWLEPWPDAPDASYAMRESVELAFVSALQHLPGNQRAALILRDVVGMSAAEVAELFETSIASITSALQRARAAVEERAPGPSQGATLRTLGSDGERAIVAAYVKAWVEADVDALVTLLAKDVTFSMPPFPTWFSGVDDVARFFGRVFARPWQLVPTSASGQLAFLCSQDGRIGALNVIALRGREIVKITGFLDPATHRAFGG